MDLKSNDSIKNINKFLNLLSLIFLAFIILIFFFQFDIVRGNYIKDIPNIIKYNSFRFNISNIYSNAIFYGVNIKFIIYLIIFNIFIFIPIGCILNIQNISKKKSIIIFLIISILYELIKSLLHISQLGMDMVFLHFIGLYLGHVVTRFYVYKAKDRFLKKGILLIIFFFIFTLISQFRIIYEFFFIDLNSTTEQNFIEEVRLEKLYDPYEKYLYDSYKKYLESITDNKQIKGDLKGLLFKDNYLFVNISDEIHKFKIDGESKIIDKQVLDYDHHKIYVHPRLNDIFKDNLDDKNICKINERLATLISSGAEVNVIFDENNILKFLCISSELYKNGVNKF
ncbi:hypothetical protein KQI41_06180 [Tissierella pigra]|uniref:VanZ-like domain-containing protein n=1 Tax=Tissierella pigra TaxID=2607614 RepID=A0A6N7XXY1_9FIRM|nr:hypothetical protein [Tissierella pigra]MBU5425999.1 hypothetical protein [Tissierella pigra]MSU00640.1 hypothetical protein [Tissierella pigra]